MAAVKEYAEACLEHRLPAAVTLGEFPLSGYFLSGRPVFGAAWSRRRRGQLATLRIRT